MWSIGDGAFAGGYNPVAAGYGYGPGAGNANINCTMIVSVNHFPFLYWRKHVQYRLLKCPNINSSMDCLCAGENPFAGKPKQHSGEYPASTQHSKRACPSEKQLIVLYYKYT